MTDFPPIVYPDGLIERYHELTEKHFLAMVRDGVEILPAPKNYGLSEEEAAELEAVDAQIQECQKPYSNALFDEIEAATGSRPGKSE